MELINGREMADVRRQGPLGFAPHQRFQGLIAGLRCVPGLPPVAQHGEPNPAGHDGEALLL
jgi:hypothetical protein